MKIEDYALIGDCRTAALVGRNGSIDWLCWPRFDSPACFAALLGTGDNGFWRISPTKPFRSRRAYRPGTLVLETEFETDGGAVTLVDFMPVGDRSDRRHREDAPSVGRAPSNEAKIGLFETPSRHASVDSSTRSGVLPGKTLITSPGASASGSGGATTTSRTVTRHTP